jgi:hypothetical protein
LLQSAPHLYKLDGPNRLRILADLPDGDSRIGALQALFERLGPPLSSGRLDYDQLHKSNYRT